MPFKHNNIEYPTSRIWNRKEVTEIAKQCEDAGYDVVRTPESIVVGLAETDQIFLKSLKGHGTWLTRYDQRLFDENFAEESE